MGPLRVSYGASPSYFLCMYCALANPIAPFERGRTADAGKLDHREHHPRNINEGRSDQALCGFSSNWMECLHTKPFPRTPGGAIVFPLEGISVWENHR